MKRDFIPLCEPFIGEEEKQAVAEVLDSKWISQGEKVKEFERACASYLGSRNAVAVSSCTAALHLCLLAEGIKGNVVVPDFTVCTPNAVVHAGATPILVDVNPSTYTIDYAEANWALEKYRGAAIIPVHLFGQACDLSYLMGDTLLIEDAAGAFGAELYDKKVGTIGHYGCFSFDARKILTIGEGGLIVTNNDEKADWLRMARSHGGNTDIWKRHYDLAYQDVHFPIVGLNYRMTDYQAAIGLAQLKKIDFILKRRREIAKIYTDLLGKVKEITTPYVPDYSKHVFQSYVIRLKNTSEISLDDLITLLRQNKVQATYGSRAMHLEAFKNLPCYRSDYGPFHSTELAKRTVALPIFPGMTDEEVHYVCSCMGKVE